ncbi:hypothetical protein BH10PLA1_BH10PLA1_18840 [soil metagenome]
MSLLASFFKQRTYERPQTFNAIGGTSTNTILLSSHIWWTDLMAFALLSLGYNVHITPPWYVFWNSDKVYDDFDRNFVEQVREIKRLNVKLIIGGNSTAFVPHKNTGELIHRAAGVPIVHFWWDAPRVAPPMCKRDISLRTYIDAMRDPQTLNVIWDIDVMEEMSRFLGVTNCAHVPLGTTPEIWTTPYVPLEDRTVAVSFLGTAHPVTDEQKAAWDPSLRDWAEQTVTTKLANPDRPMVDCVGRVKAVPRQRVADEKPDPDALFRREFDRWEIVDAMLAERVRTKTVLAVAERVKDGLELIGSDWDKFGLTVKKNHSGIPDSRFYYAAAKASLNLFGGCVHGGMPLRPYEIASSGGLIFTQYQRELPNLYEPGKECVAFKNTDEMLDQLDRILTHPADYNAVVQAGLSRTIAEHTWKHRMKRVIDLATERLGIHWQHS